MFGWRMRVCYSNGVRLTYYKLSDRSECFFFLNSYHIARRKSIGCESHLHSQSSVCFEFRLWNDFHDTQPKKKEEKTHLNATWPYTMHYTRWKEKRNIKRCRKVRSRVHVKSSKREAKKARTKCSSNICVLRGLWIIYLVPELRCLFSPFFRSFVFRTPVVRKIHIVTFTRPNARARAHVNITFCVMWSISLISRCRKK